MISDNKPQMYAFFIKHNVFFFDYFCGVELIFLEEKKGLR